MQERGPVFAPAPFYAKMAVAEGTEMTPSEREGIRAALLTRLDATNPALDASPLWNFIAEHVSRTLTNADDQALERMYKVVLAYEALVAKR